MKVFQDVTKKPKRSDVCLEVTQNHQSLMGLAEGAMYGRRYFDQQSQGVATELVRDMRNAFVGMLQTNSWMHPQIRNYAIEKVISKFLFLC